MSHGALGALVAALVLLGACGSGSAGYPVRTAPALGPRGLVAPALRKGLIQLVPEYAGSALEFACPGRAKGTSDIEATHRALVDTLSPNGVVARAPARAQDATAIVVTNITAARYGLRTVPDLAPLAERCVSGGPAERPARARCPVAYGTPMDYTSRASSPSTPVGPSPARHSTPGHRRGAPLHN